MLGQMSSRRRVPQHLPSGRGVSGHYSFRTPSVMANVLRTMHATAFSIQTRSVRAFCFGTQRVSYRRRVSRQMSSGRGVSGHYSFRTPSVKANVLRTACTTASAFRSAHYSFRTPSVKANVVRTTQATASAFRTRSVRAFCFRTQRVSYGRRVSRQFSSRLSASRQMSGRRLRWRTTHR